MVSMELSIIIPVFNEKLFIAETLKRVSAVDLDKEVIVIDDCSSDGTRELLQELAGASKGDEGFKFLFQDKNYGKGAALRRGFKEAMGDVIIVQDAELECDPQDYYALLQPIKMGLASVVYGSRFLDGSCQTMSFRHYFANRFLTFLANVFIGQSLTDMETCYKVFRREVLDGIEIKENRFGFEPEITAKIANKGYQIHEVPISYHPRTYCEGKKIKWKDGFEAIWCIIKYNLIG